MTARTGGRGARSFADRGTWLGRAVVVSVTVAVVAELLRVGGGVSGSELAASWQVIDLEVLRDGPLHAVWFLHVQPPLHNLVVGAVVAWSPFPEAGTLFALYALCLLGLGLVLHDLLRRWGLPPLAAASVAAVAVANPGLLSTIRLASYEVPLALMLVLLVGLIDRHLDRPTTRSLLALAGVATAMVLTRSLFHPVWLAGVGLVVVLARPLDRRRVAVVALVPLVLVGGWVLKNQVLFGVPTLSSWDGFNLQRGVTSPMDALAVQRAVQEGDVSPLALLPAFQSLDAYAAQVSGCRPGHTEPAVAEPTKTVAGQQIANFNSECYLPLYRQARADALTLIRREPARYLRGRVLAAGISHASLPVGTEPAGLTFLGDAKPSLSWMDRLYGPILVRQTVTVSTMGWNQSLMGIGAPYVLVLSWTLVGLSTVVLVRTAVSAVRVVRTRWRGANPEAWEVRWLVAGGTVLFVIIGSDLVELGENGRFRTMVDPLVLGLVVAEVWRDAGRWRARRAVTGG